MHIPTEDYQALQNEADYAQVLLDALDDALKLAREEGTRTEEWKRLGKIAKRGKELLRTNG